METPAGQAIHGVLARRASLAMCLLLLSLVLIGMRLTAPGIVAQRVELSVDVSKTGSKIDRNIFWQFACPIHGRL
jgi:hypothetical protein